MSEVHMRKSESWHYYMVIAPLESFRNLSTGFLTYMYALQLGPIPLLGSILYGQTFFTEGRLSPLLHHPNPHTLRSTQ